MSAKPPAKPHPKSAVNSRRRDHIASSAAPKSQKLERTLIELESAFTDWETLSNGKARPQAPKALLPPKKVTETANEAEFRKKTKKLLTQLRKQLNDLET